MASDVEVQAWIERGFKAKFSDGGWITLRFGPRSTITLMLRDFTPEESRETAEALDLLHQAITEAREATLAKSREQPSEEEE